MFRNIQPTGRDIEFRIIAHFQFDDEGRIAQETAYYDTLSFMRQLGLRERDTPRQFDGVPRRIIVTWRQTPRTAGSF